MTMATSSQVRKVQVPQLGCVAFVAGHLALRTAVKWISTGHFNGDYVDACGCCIDIIYIYHISYIYICVYRYTFYVYTPFNKMQILLRWGSCYTTVPHFSDHSRDAAR